MSFTLTEVKENIIAMGHSGSLNKVRSFEAACERAANTMIAKVKLVEMIRKASLTQNIHSNLYDYSLPSDFYSIIDLYPQDREMSDKAIRNLAVDFDLKKLLKNKVISIEGNEGNKIIRIKWEKRSPKMLNSMDSYNGNGTWVAVGTASDIQTDNIIKYSGNGAVKFNVLADGDGIQCTDIAKIDLTDEENVADVIIPIYLSSIANLTSITPIWGNDLTANYVTGTAQTSQADGTAFRVGWNIIKSPWQGATETGTVDPATINSFKLTFQTTGAISNVRVDNILFSIGFPFEIKYYTKYLFKSSAGVYESRPSSDESSVVCDNDSLQIFLLELLKAIAHQLEGTDSVFDISFANSELVTLYRQYLGENQDQTKKATSSYSGLPRFRR